jgi:hypothetical protein
MSLKVPYPEAILALFDVDGTPEARVFGYGDSQIGARLADAFDVELRVVPRPVNTPDAPAPGTLDASHLTSRLEQSPNLILQGPPGTGKTSLALEIVRRQTFGTTMTVDECRFGRLLDDSHGDIEALVASGSLEQVPVVWELVQLHPGYAYDDLVRRIVPKTTGGVLRFEAEDRLLPQLCRIAEAVGPERPVVLILDEVNRCDFAATMGEFIFAMDPGWRGQLVRLQYQWPGMSPSVSMPRNLWLVGTMNTADRSIAMVDYAVRRRFRFVDVRSDPAVVSSWYAAHAPFGAIARELLDACNVGLDERIQVGHADFLEPIEPRETWVARLARRVAFHVLPLLEQYEKEGLRAVGPVSWRHISIDVRAPRLATTELVGAINGALADSD